MGIGLDSFMKECAENASSVVSEIAADHNKRQRDAVNLAAKSFIGILKKESKRIYREAAEEFYSKKTNKIYDRTESLKNLLSFTMFDFDDAYGNGAQWTDRVSGDNMVSIEREGKPNTLFNLVVMEGWHGGAYGDGHPGGGPRYRTPHPYYSRWGYEAVRSEPIFDIYNRNVEAYIAEDGEGGALYIKMVKDAADAVKPVY